MERMTVYSKSEFARVLRDWWNTPNEETIGTIGSYGGSPLLTLQLDGLVINLNADTSRSAVEKYLQAVDARGAESTWRVLFNNKGVANKVDFEISGPPTPGWYCYLKTPLDREGTV